jgi:hypothetical protein
MRLAVRSARGDEGDSSRTEEDLKGVVLFIETYDDFPIRIKKKSVELPIDKTRKEE